MCMHPYIHTWPTISTFSAIVRVVTQFAKLSAVLFIKAYGHDTSLSAVFRIGLWWMNKLFGIDGYAGCQRACSEFYFHILAQLGKSFSLPPLSHFTPPCYIRFAFSFFQYTTCVCVFHGCLMHFREKDDKDLVKYFIRLKGSRISKTTQRSMVSIYLCNCLLHYYFQAFSLCLPRWMKHVSCEKKAIFC